MLHGKAHGVFAAQAASGIEGVFDMRLDGIGIVQYRGYAALRPVGRAVGQVALAQYGNAQVLRQRECQRQAGGTATDDQNVVLVMLAHVRIPRKASSSI